MLSIRIDAHQHFWQLNRGDYDWLQPDMGVIYQDFHPEDLQPHLKQCDLDASIVVQAAPTRAETEYLLDLYDHYPNIAGVVGWLDLAAKDFPEHLRALQKRQGFVGLRPMLQDIADESWILRPDVLANIERMIVADTPLDLLVTPRHLPSIIALLRRYPNLRAVVNHAAKPPIAQQKFEPWLADMKEIATYQGVMCKLSGLITEADHKSWSANDIRPYISEVLNMFGDKRVMFGSDWPVCQLAGSYQQVYDLLRTSLSQTLTTTQLDNVFGRNAMTFYRLPVKDVS